jgi:polyferredoxin
MQRQGLKGWALSSVKNRGALAWAAAAALCAFYVVLYFGQYYWTPESCTTDETCWSEGAVCVESQCIREDRLERAQGWLYDNATIHLDRAGWAIFASIDAQRELDGSLTRDTNDNGTLDPWEHFGSRWTIYGLLYTVAIVLGGLWVSYKYRHNRYQLVRTAVVMFVQVSFAFSIPTLLKFFHQPEYYFTYLWPLKIDQFDPNTSRYYVEGYPYGEMFVLYAFAASLIAMPILTLLFGKRWYCSWVCGCGGLANTFGEPWRHLGTKSMASWKIEKITIHTTLIVALVSTAVWMLAAVLPAESGFGSVADGFRRWYGLIVVAALSGVAGVALYPIAGTRVWCRFFCPMAAVLGLIQKLGRYRIRVKKDMCISCGMCTTYCEMGIDVRAYAQANQSFTRASCVGCGMCAEVCPRGVLRLENAAKRDPQELSMSAFLDQSWK